MIVDTCWGPREIIDKPYWHLVPNSGANAMMFYNNVKVGKGALLSVSAGIRAEPHIENAHSPYSFSRLGDEKEAVFESVRKGEFPTYPSRLKSIYLFDDYSLVERAFAEWFPNESKSAHECRVLLNSASHIHKADAAWLNCSQIDWEVCARKYWSGIMSDLPFPETIVDGAIYFPAYKTFPSPASFSG
jgi:hypothetical protein